MSIFVMGLDLGQAQDFTAQVICQATGTQYDSHLVGLPLTQCDVRHIDRYDLGTRYTDIAVDVGKRLRQVPQPRYLVIDETGVGRGVLEMFSGLGAHGITITGTGQATLTAPMHVHVPKRDLVSTAQVALQNGVLKIGRNLKHADTLVKELLPFRTKIVSFRQACMTRQGLVATVVERARRPWQRWHSRQQRFLKI
jgi:hypothetical protein